MPEKIYCLMYQHRFPLFIVRYVSFILTSKALSMIEFWVVSIQRQRFIIIDMSLLKLFQIQIDISPIEIVNRVLIVCIYSTTVITNRLVHDICVFWARSCQMVETEPQIVIVEG